MVTLILIVASLTFNVFSYVPTLSWLSIVAFTLSVCTWVLSRKMYKLNNTDNNSKIIMILSIISTFVGLFGIVYNFLLGGLLFGYMSGFMSN